MLRRKDQAEVLVFDYVTTLNFSALRGPNAL